MPVSDESRGGESRSLLIVKDGGGIIDDLIITRTDKGFCIILNASTLNKFSKEGQCEAQPGIEICSTGRNFINFVEGDVEKYPYVQIWDIIPEDPSAFAKAQTEFVESLPELFKDRFVGFGTYDINRPNGATHWALLSGTNLDDHLKFTNDVQTTYSKKFKKYLEDRGAVELIHNFTFDNKSFIK